MPAGIQGVKNLETTEFMSLEQSPVKGPNLPFSFKYHRMVQVDEKTIYLIGGCQDDQWSKKTWIFDPTKNFEFKEGPTLNHVASDHACATMQLNGKVLIIVYNWNALTRNNNSKETVEILDTSSPRNGWKIGMYV